MKDKILYNLASHIRKVQRDYDAVYYCTTSKWIDVSDLH